MLLRSELLNFFGATQIRTLPVFSISWQVFDEHLPVFLNTWQVFGKYLPVFVDSRQVFVNSRQVFGKCLPVFSVSLQVFRISRQVFSVSLQVNVATLQEKTAPFWIKPSSSNIRRFPPASAFDDRHFAESVFAANLVFWFLRASY